MSDDTIKIGVDVNSNGTTDREINKSEKLRVSLEAAAKAATKVGGTAGSRAVAAGYKPGSMTEEDYNKSKGITGTGAAGRDFAKQAQGLDGLVRLYAIYAANVFAAGAAFRALSDAMDTTNMVQGLNQLGAASGVAMGSLAKQFADASGGAISLRESMEATSKAISSGMSQTQFLKLGDVAKKASQALGVNMSDAVSRLTRGITKLEPELLDELGIFTKVGKATEDYARSIGKTADSLTDFERRQAFANAVLAEGNKKFSEIDIPTNPYDKLMATLKNVAQLGLELVNNVIGPIAKLLSSNSALLVGAMSLIGMKLVKDALPAIASWRKGIKDAADDARAKSANIVESFGEKFVESTASAFKIPLLQQNLKTAEAEYEKSRKRFLNIDEVYTDKQKKNKFYSTMAAGGEMSPASMQREITRLTKEDTAASLKAAEALKTQREEYTRILALRQRLATAQDRAQEKADQPSFGEYLRTRISKASAARAERLGILAGVSKDVSEGGFGYAMKELNAAVADSKTLGWFDKLRTKIMGTFIAGANSIGIFMSAFSGIFTGIGTIISVLSFALPLFRNNEEAADRFSATIDQVKDSSENAYRVLERIGKLDPLQALSIDSLAAKATALEGLGSLLVKAIDDFEKEVTTRNWADTAVNIMAGIFGKSSEDKMAKQISTALERAVALAGSTDGARELRGRLASLLSLGKDATDKQIQSAFKSANLVIQKEVVKEIEKTGKTALASAGSFKTFNDGLADSAKLYQDLINASKNSTPLTKFAEDAIKKILDLTKALETADISAKLMEMSKLSKDINFLQLFSPQVAKAILAQSQELDTLSEGYAQAEQDISGLETAIQHWKSILDDFPENPIKSAIFGKPKDIQEAEDAMARLNDMLGKAKEKKDSVEGNLTSASARFNDSLRLGLLDNINYFTKGLEESAKKVGIELYRAFSEGVSDPRLKVQMQSKANLQSIGLEKEQLQTQLNLIDSNADLRLAIMENTHAINISRVIKPGESVEAALARPENKGLLEESRSIATFRQYKGSSMATLKAMLGQGDMSAGVRQGLGEAVGTAQARLNIESKMKELGGKAQAERIRSTIAGISADSAVEVKNLQEAQKYNDASLEYYKTAAWWKDLDLKQQQDILESFASISDYTKEQLATAEERKNVTTSEYLVREAERTGNKAALADAKAALSYDQQKLTAAEQTAKTVTAAAKAAREQANSNAAAAHQVALANIEWDRQNQLQKISIDTQSKLDDIRKQELQYLLDTGQISENAYGAQVVAIERASMARQRDNELKQLEIAYLTEVNNLVREYASADTARRTEISATLASKSDQYAAQVEGVNKVFDAQSSLFEQQNSLTKQQQGYAEIFKNSFNSMADAMVEWARTGKLSGKDLFTSLLADLARYELRLQMMQVYGAFRTAMFGPAAGIGGATFSPETAQLFGWAKGGAFDGGLQKFAQGGTFTNSIVSSPTLFKFAQGTGLMGEAGPEAIMPLTRDSSGNLGVRSAGGQQGDVQVVVNNYSNAQATTRETQDGRGNRRIEVVIGEAAAGEMARSGSNTQGAMRSTYGLTPQLIRR